MASRRQLKGILRLRGAGPAVHTLVMQKLMQKLMQV